MLSYVKEEKQIAFFMLSWVEHEKSFITSGPGLNSMSLNTFTVTVTVL